MNCAARWSPAIPPETTPTVRIRFVATDGNAQEIDAAIGLSLMETAIRGEIAGIVADCGGNAYCGTCRVHVAPEWRARVGEATEIEQPMIEASGDEDPGVRLSCQFPSPPSSTDWW